ncbi:hypothetical protein BBH88_01805 [Planococcus antarcticus DSM 14505]|uniref:Arylamine N-acetyltransferase n=1 Tax=Planococcus antarcticus DSM 14505 TaxID=1185653 RepID=A0ABM6D170_9BACL|nr:hypothetical protein [Planococcus antarcticus]ANU09155.1 hypothetical protein BBH88_01805 [Planococcus antarcticus DSM 14505]
MKAPEEILAVWQQFDNFPMETLTKAWYYQRSGEQKQRGVELMKQHHDQYGITGNCFDLAIWLLTAFDRAGVKAYPVGSGLGTEQAHAAIMAEDQNGRRFLCDLGDQWIQPILVEVGSPEFKSGRLAGFFPGAEVQVKPADKGIEVSYYRPNGKQSDQVYTIEPVERADFLEAAEYSQHHIHPEPLVEVRLQLQGETVHWEFDNWKSFLSTSTGLYPDDPIKTLEDWVERIQVKTQYDKEFLLESLGFYQKLNLSSKE